MAHIHTEPGQHDQTASAWIISERAGEPKLLLHRHKLLGVMLEPGGHVELNETPWQAVLHEILEETGYEPNQLKVLQPKDRLKALGGAILHPYPLVSNSHKFDAEGNHIHTDLAYAFITDQEPNQSIGDGESSEFKWLNLTEIKALPATDIFENVRQIAEYVLGHVAMNWEAVNPNEFEA